jgi:predicted ATPase
LKTLGNKLSLSAVWLAELSRLLPEIQDFYPNLPEPQQVNGTAGRQRLFTAVGRFLHALTNDRQPLILFLDDLQWADSTTIDLLHYLIRQNRDNLLLVLGTYRPEETPPTHPITVLRRGLSRDRLVRLIQLKPLTEVDIQQVAERLVGLELAHEFARYLYQESEGNPFVLTEMLNTLHEAELLWPIELDRWGLTANWKNQATQMTSSLRDTILNRVERLPHPEQELLKLAAVIGRTFEADLLQAVSQRSARSSLVIWQERRLVRLVSTADTGHQYDFAHDKIREVVYHQLPTAERQLLHGEVGIGLESRNGAQSPSTPLAPAIAYHYFESDRPNQALPFLLTAAQQAQQALAFTTVIRLCSQALALEPDDLNLRFECLRLRQKSFEYLGEPVREEEDVLAMLAIAEKRQDSQQAMIAQKRLSIFYMHRDPVKAQEIIDRTLPLYQAAGDRANEVETLIIAAILRRNAGETEKAFVLFNQSRQVAFEIGDAKSEGFSLGYIALEQVRQGLLGEAADNYERGATLLRSAHDQSVELGYHLIGTANLYRILGRFTEASETIEQAWQIGVGLEHMGIQCWVHLHRGKVALWQAEHHKAQPHYQKALMVADRHEFGILKGHAYWGLGVANLANGAYQHAVNMLLDALKQFTGSHLARLCTKKENDVRVE